MKGKTVRVVGIFRSNVAVAILLLLGIALAPVLLAGCSETTAEVAADTEPPETVASTATVRTASGTEVKIETKTVPIPYESVYEEDASINLGEFKVTQEGEDGAKEVTYRVTYTNGIETAREVISEVVTKQPVNHVEAVGTHVTHHEDPTATTGTTTTSTTSTTPQQPGSTSGCPSGAVAICADGTVSMGSNNPSVPVCAGRGGVAQTCP